MPVIVPVGRHATIEANSWRRLSLQGELLRHGDHALQLLSIRIASVSTVTIATDEAVIAG